MAATISITGHLAHDPTLETVGDDKTICRLRVGYSVNRGKSDGNFIDVTTWGPAAENHARWLKKGSPIRIDGELAFEQWVKDDQKQSRHTVINANVEYLGSKADNTGGSDKPTGGL